MTGRSLWAIALPIAALFISGCAIPAPRDDAKRVERAIADAVDAGAAHYAPVELSLARDKLSVATRIGDKDPEATRWLLEQALVDAELAAVKTRATVLTTAHQ